MTEQRRILNMLSEGKITAVEAEKLLTAMGSADPGDKTSPAAATTSATGTPKFLCVKVEPKNEGGDRVNIKVPLKIVKSGMKLSSLMPENVREKTQEAMDEKGINFKLENLNPENVDDFLKSLSDFTIDVDSGNETVKVYCC